MGAGSGDQYPHGPSIDVDAASASHCSNMSSQPRNAHPPKSAGRPRSRPTDALGARSWLLALIACLGTIGSLTGACNSPDVAHGVGATPTDACNTLTGRTTAIPDHQVASFEHGAATVALFSPVAGRSEGPTRLRICVMQSTAQGLSVVYEGLVPVGDRAGAVLAIDAIVTIPAPVFDERLTVAVGQVDSLASMVEVILDSGGKAVAVVGGGYFTAAWDGESRLLTARALDANGIALPGEVVDHT